jgi:hypothetical protein
VGRRMAQLSGLGMDEVGCGVTTISLRTRGVVATIG